MHLYSMYECMVSGPSALKGKKNVCMARKTFKKSCLLVRKIENMTVDRLESFDFHAHSQEVLLIIEFK